MRLLHTIDIAAELLVLKPQFLFMLYYELDFISYMPFQIRFPAAANNAHNFKAEHDMLLPNIAASIETFQQ